MARYTSEVVWRHLSLRTQPVLCQIALAVLKLVIEILLFIMILLGLNSILAFVKEFEALVFHPPVSHLIGMLQLVKIRLVDVHNTLL